ncbi:MAG: mechanosensitive ion channel family protein [Erythrobacter sp.]
MIQTLIEQLNTMAEDLVASIPAIVIALMIILLTAVIAKSATRISKKLIGKTELRPSLRNLLDTLVRLGVWVTGMMIAGIVVFPNFSPSSLIAGLGIGAVAIGFAFQDFFENFLAGVMIMLRDKMQIGDVIKTGDIHGTIEFISLRESHIRAFSGELHVLPNSQLFKDPVEIITDLKERRYELVIGVAYDTDLDRASEVIRASLESCDLINAERDIYVLADAFNSSSVDFIVRWWAASSGAASALNRDQAVRAIKHGLDEAGIEIPFPQVTNTFKGRLPLEQSSAEDETTAS